MCDDHSKILKNKIKMVRKWKRRWNFRRPNISFRTRSLHILLYFMWAASLSFKKGMREYHSFVCLKRLRKPVYLLLLFHVLLLACYSISFVKELTFSVYWWFASTAFIRCVQVVVKTHAVICTQNVKSCGLAFLRPPLRGGRKTARAVTFSTNAKSRHLVRVRYSFPPLCDICCEETTAEVIWKLRGMPRPCCSSFTHARTFLRLLLLVFKAFHWNSHGWLKIADCWLQSRLVHCARRFLELSTRHRFS